MLPAVAQVEAANAEVEASNQSRAGFSSSMLDSLKSAASEYEVDSLMVTYSSAFISFVPDPGVR
jgi:hypothetical protein